MKIELYGIEIEVEYTYEYISDGDEFYPDTGDTVEIEEITIGGEDAYEFILQSGFYPDIENIILSKETTF